MQEIISSWQNSKIKNILNLRKPRERKRQDLIVIEGGKEVEAAKKSGLEMVEFFYCPELAGKKTMVSGSEPATLVRKKVFEKISYRENPDGFLALAKPRYFSFSDLRLSKNPLLIVLAGVEKPGNLGAIMRSADAAGVEAIILNGQQTEIYNPNVIRASLGTIFSRPIISASISDTKKWLKNQGIKTFAAVVGAGKIYYQADFRKPAAIIMGAESAGLDREWIGQADERINIPMRGRADSLNVSVSAAVVLFEALRQRAI